MDGPYHVLPADGTLAHPLPALGASDHVATFQQDTVNGCIHADFAEVFLRAWEPSTTSLIISVRN